MPDNKQLKERLRGSMNNRNMAYWDLFNEAADTIERLEAELKAHDIAVQLTTPTRLRERLERIRDLDEQTSDGALGSLARYALDELRELAAQRNRLHKALAEGNGVEDGGIWEDRALQAEAKLATLEAERERDAAVLESAMAERLMVVAHDLENDPRADPGTYLHDVGATLKEDRRRQAALQHAQEQVGEDRA